MDRRPFSRTRPRNATGAWAALVAFAVAPLGSGCSFIFSQGPPDGHRSLATFQCGESYAPPVVDSIAVALFGLGILGGVTNENAEVARSANPAQTRHDDNVAIGLLSAFTILDIASAVYGFGAVGSCHEAQDARRADLAAARILPVPYGVPPNGDPPPTWPPRRAPAPAPYSPPPAPSATAPDPAPPAPDPAPPAPDPAPPAPTPSP
jgi:hypothetical protein